MTKEIFTMRISPKVRRALDEAARRDMRPPTQLAAKIIAEHLMAKGFLKPADVVDVDGRTRAARRRK